MTNHETDGGLSNSPVPATAAPLPTERGRRIQHAPSLDVIAAQTAMTAPAPADAIPQDSRSSSSTNSPIPNDNEESDFFLVTNDSQSSLGVPNLQDMQVNDNECLAPINRLPNEILIAIFAKLSSTADQLHCMLVCKRWARNAVDLLWHRPACSSWPRHQSICQTLGVDAPYFAYRDFIKRLNLASIADKVNDGSVMPLAVCTRVERLTLTNCKGLTDIGLIALVENSSHLLALDISGDDQITEAAIIAIADNCKRLQGLNISNCTRVANEGLIKLAQNCRYIKRLKLNDCVQLADECVLAFAEHCPNILEVDLQHCRWVTNQPITDLLAKGQSLRELRLVGCDHIDDSAFLSLPPGRTYEHLRILDLTSCSLLTDRAVEKIIEVAPRLRNLVFAKCRLLTDAAVNAIAKLGKNLHYVHLGHCSQITDDAVKRLVRECNRIRYIDLGCCQNLTDDSVMKLATLPKLKRIGLVKCSSISDESVLALARANQRLRQRRDADGNPSEGFFLSSSLERVHLSYCTNLTLKSIAILLNACPRLTHLSLTGVHAFLRDDLSQFCRDAPPEFTQHQRDVFCVFSGQGVYGLRRHMNSDEFVMNPNVPPANHHEAAFDDQEPDAIDDDDVQDDGSEMVIDTQPLLANGIQVDVPPDNLLIPPPPPPPLPAYLAAYPVHGTTAPGQTFTVVDEQGNPFFPGGQSPVSEDEEDDAGDAMDVSPQPTTSSAAANGMAAVVSPQALVSGANPASTGSTSQHGTAGPSTAQLRLPQGRTTNAPAGLPSTLNTPGESDEDTP